MPQHEEGFNLEMPKVGVIKGVLAKDIEVTGEKVVNVRTCARPYRNFYSANQLRRLARIAKKYGSGKVHLSPRHNLEIPEVRQKELNNALRELYIAGLFPGGAGTSVRNIFTCPDWCRKAIMPVQELGLMVSKNFGDMDMPNKVTISFAGCFNGCSRPYNTDIGIYAMAEVVLNKEIKCETDCNECVLICPFNAITINRGNIEIDEYSCTGCLKCIEVCKPAVLSRGKEGFMVLVGGKEGLDIRWGRPIKKGIDDFSVLETIDTILRWYSKEATFRRGSKKKKERLAEVLDRLGPDSILLCPPHY